MKRRRVGGGCPLRVEDILAVGWKMREREEGRVADRWLKLKAWVGERQGRRSQAEREPGKAWKTGPGKRQG